MAASRAFGFARVAATGPQSSPPGPADCSSSGWRVRRRRPARAEVVDQPDASQNRLGQVGLLGQCAARPSSPRRLGPEPLAIGLAPSVWATTSRMPAEADRASWQLGSVQQPGGLDEGKQLTADVGIPSTILSTGRITRPLGDRLTPACTSEERCPS